MTGRAKRLAMMVGMAALAAVVAVSLIGPDAAAAPREKTSFTISTDMTGTDWLVEGTWQARGALSESGGHVWDWGDWTLKFFSPDPAESDHSWMMMQLNLDNDTFKITEAYGVYDYMLNATGTYTCHVVRRYNDMYGEWQTKGGYKLTGSLAE